MDQLIGFKKLQALSINAPIIKKPESSLDKKKYNFIKNRFKNLIKIKSVSLKNRT